jgi:tetratricopeptide (TPR) repeat protein
MYPVLRLVPFAAAVVAVFALTTAASAISTESAYVQLQLAKLLFTDGRYGEAFNAFEQVKGHDDARIKREALTGTVKSALRLGDFSHAYADGQLLARSSSTNPESLANYADALWAVGLFQDAEKKFEESLAIQKDNARALHGLARSLAARNRATSICCRTKTAARKRRGPARKCASCARSARARLSTSSREWPAGCTRCRSAC